MIDGGAMTFQVPSCPWLELRCGRVALWPIIALLPLSHGWWPHPAVSIRQLSHGLAPSRKVPKHHLDSCCSAGPGRDSTPNAARHFLGCTVVAPGRTTSSKADQGDLCAARRSGASLMLVSMSDGVIAARHGMRWIMGRSVRRNQARRSTSPPVSRQASRRL